jgi:single-stranded-DNA-specific exonuclease
MLEKRWKFPEKPITELVDALSAEINVGQELASILVQRGISSYDAAKSFFRPSLDHLHDPFLMKDMEKAVERLILALDKKEHILIYGDYDVDGTTSVTLVYSFLSKFHDRITYYIPDRYTEGYGVSKAGIQFAIENQVGLIISLDCGIKSSERVAEAKAAGIDFIICDHHNPDISDMPDALAILDPKQHDCLYPYKELSGCGVGFKFLQAYCLRTGYDLADLFSYLDLLAISIASDIVPITGENRILAYFGLEGLNKNPRPGVKALIEFSGLRKEVDITTIVFGIGPRINAAGRIEHARNAVELLLESDPEKIEFFASVVNNTNSFRRDIDSNITQEALEMIHLDGAINARSTVLFNPEWHKGVIGIVASRCIERYYRPTIILTEANGFATGSARSIAGFDLYEAICRCSDLLEQFGGHTYAAGLSLKIDKIAEFKTRFEAITQEVLSEEDMIPVINVDYLLSFNKIHFKFFNIIQQMAPFGPGNLNPVFVSENVYISGKSRLLKDKHLKMNLMQKGSDQVLDAIGFNLGHCFDQVASGREFDICYSVEENTFNGKTSLQLNIKDIKFNN